MIHADIQQIRLDNLRALIVEARSAAKLARACETSASYLSQILNGTPGRGDTPRGVGNVLARKLEAGTGKPRGWLDQAHAPKRTESNPHARRVPGTDTSIDTYDVQRMWQIVDPAIAHAHKKLQRYGRGAKSLDQDVREARDSLNSYLARVATREQLDQKPDC